MTYYYGSWSAPVVHTEIIHAVDGSREYPSGVAAQTGWQLNSTGSYAASGEATLQTPGGIASPPDISLGNSADAFDQAYVNDAAGSSATVGGSIAHGGSLRQTTVSMWSQHDTWTLRGSYARLGYRIPTGIDWGEMGGEPPPEEWPDGVVWTERESNEWEFLSFAVTGIGDARWSIYLKPPMVAEPWFAELLSVGGEAHPVRASMHTRVDGQSVSLSLDDMLTFVQERKSGVAWDQYDHRVPMLAVVYDGPFPGAAGPEDYIESYDGPVGSLVVTVQAPRWRYVYSEPPVEEIIYRAPRRVFPRDDGLTGGARRTWPPSKGYQWGNRVDGSGYL